MIRYVRYLRLAAFVVVLNAPALAITVPVVVESSAQRALFDRAVRDRARSVIDQLQSDNGTGLLAQMVAIDASDDLSPVQIDAVFFDLVQRMRAIQPELVGPDDLEYLKRRPPRAVRLHDESASYQVPLFDVAGALRGVENQWAWSAGFNAVTRPGSISVADLLQRYAAGPEQPFARGLRAALPSASTTMLDKLAAAALDQRLIDHFLPYVWLARNELDGLSQWLPAGPGPRVADVLRLATTTLDPDQFLALGQAMLAHPDAGTRALTLALVTDHYMTGNTWPSDWAGQLWRLLEDVELRSSAALQLARLGAASRWQANPESAPADALDSASLEHIRAMEQSLASTQGAVQ